MTEGPRAAASRSSSGEQPPSPNPRIERSSRLRRAQQQLNQLRANILEFVASEKKARERDPGEELPEVDIRSLYLASLARVAVLLTLLQAEAEETGLTITQVQKRTKAGNRKYIVAALQEMEENGWVEKTKAGKSAYWRLSEEGMKLAVESERTFRSIFPKE